MFNYCVQLNKMLSSIHTHTGADSHLYICTECECEERIVSFLTEEKCKSELPQHAERSFDCCFHGYLKKIRQSELVSGRHHVSETEKATDNLTKNIEDATKNCEKNINGCYTLSTIHNYNAEL